MEFKLNKGKTKPLSFLLNTIRDKDEHYKTAKYSFLLGSGCSVTSNLPSGKEVMEICRKLNFVENHIDGHIISNDKAVYSSYKIEVDKFVEGRKADFDRYVQEIENTYKANLFKVEIINRIPESIIQSIREEGKLDDIQLEEKLVEIFSDRVLIDTLYGKWFNEYSQDPRKRQKLIEDIVEGQNVSGEYILFANLIDQGLIHNIFTTNFDDLLYETLLIYVNKKARVYSHNEIARYISIGSSKPNIIKLHGDYRYENIKNIEAETRKLDENMGLKFREALNHLDLVVVGYSGVDSSIMKQLEELKNQREFCILWCASSEDNLHWRVVNLINSTENSFFIKVENFSTLVFQLWTVNKSNFKDISEIFSVKHTEFQQYIESFNTKIQNNENLLPSDKSKFNEAVKVTELFNLAYNTSNTQTKIELYTQCIDLDSLNFYAYNNRGVALNKLLRYSKAIEDFSKAISINSNFLMAYANRAGVYRMQGLIKEATKDIDFALTASPTDMSFRSIKAMLYSNTKKFTEALEIFDELILLVPSNPSNYFNKGYCYEEKGNFTKEIKYYDLALENYKSAEECGFPERDVLYNNISVVYRRTKDYDKVEYYFNKATEANPDYAFSYGTMALTYADQGNEEKFYKFIEIAFQKGAPIWIFLADPGFDKYKDSKRFNSLMDQYRQ